MEGEKNNKPVKNFVLPISIALILILVLAGGGFSIFKSQKSKTTANIAQLPETTTTTSENIKSSFSYKDGTYSAIGEYKTPGGMEKIGIKITVKDDTVSNTSIQIMGIKPNSKRFQTIFSNNYKHFVIGKKIDEILLDKVSGSSLSPKGFNNALEKIKQQAKI